MNQLLTDKCLEHFKEYFQLNNGYISLSDRFYDEFIEMPLSMQWGVIQDFADSKGLRIECERLPFGDFTYWVNHVPPPDIFISRNEAREESIKTFNRYYNEKVF